MSIGHLLGTDGGSLYNFYSGFAQAIGSVTILGGLATFWQHKQCHVSGCHRLAKATLEGTPYAVCHKHHPEGPLTGAKLAEIHARSRRPDSQPD